MQRNSAYERKKRFILKKKQLILARIRTQVPPIFPFSPKNSHFHYLYYFLYYLLYIYIIFYHTYTLKYTQRFKFGFEFSIFLVFEFCV